MSSCDLQGKQRLQKAAEGTEAQEDASGSLFLDVQSPELSPGDSCPPPGLFCNSSGDYSAQCSGSLDSSYGDHLFLDDMSFPEHSATASAPDHPSTFPCLQTSPASSTTMEQIPSGFPSSCASNQPLARTGSSNIPSTSQELYNLDHLTPPNDSSSSSPEKSAGGWLGPLHIAAQKGHDRIVRVLLQHNVGCDEKDSDGLTPISHAVVGGHEDVVRSLLLHGARIGNVDGQQRPSALHWATLHRRETLLRVLLNHSLMERTLIDSYDEFGKTPLHVAIDTDFETGVLMLLQFGADPKYKARKP